MKSFKWNDTDTDAAWRYVGGRRERIAKVDLEAGGYVVIVTVKHSGREVEKVGPCNSPKAAMLLFDRDARKRMMANSPLVTKGCLPRDPETLRTKAAESLAAGRRVDALRYIHFAMRAEGTWQALKKRYLERKLANGR